MKNKLIILLISLPLMAPPNPIKYLTKIDKLILSIASIGIGNSVYKHYPAPKKDVKKSIKENK